MERQVPYVRESLWQGQTFTSVDQMNKEALRWCREVAGKRIHGTTHQRPIDLFEAEERPAMLPLPPNKWEMATWTQAKVAPDSYCSVGGALYSVPWRYQGKTLMVRLVEKTVEFYYGEELVKTQPRRRDRDRQTDPSDLPPDKIAFYQRTPQWCLRQAKQVGPDTFEAVSQLLTVNTLTYLRQAQGVLRLADSYGPLRLEAACRRALCFGDPRYRTVKNILVKGLDQIGVESGERDARQVKAYLRGSQAFTLTAPPQNDGRSEQ